MIILLQCFIYIKKELERKFLCSFYEKKQIFKSFLQVT